MEVVAHLFRHAEEDQEHRRIASPLTQGRLTKKGAGQVIDAAFLLRGRIPDEKTVEVNFATSAKLRARGTALGPAYTMLNRYKLAKVARSKVDSELDLPKGDRALAKRLLEELGRDEYMRRFAAGELPAGIESFDSFNSRIFQNTVEKAISASRRRSAREKHMVFVTHDGGTPVASGFGAAFAKLTRLDPMAVKEEATGYSGPMRNGEYIGIHARNGVAHLVEFRGKWFAPGKKGEQWKEVRPK